MNVDVVVVGAGSSGVTVACRLSEDPGRSVLLLEAGLGAPLFSDADLLSNFRAQLAEGHLPSTEKANSTFPADPPHIP